MAVIQPGPLASDIRGKLNDIVFARNQGGNYIRGTHPYAFVPSEDQQECQTAVEIVSKAWSGTLTETQRRSWRAYAHRWPAPDRWGEYRLTSGYNYFIRCNVYPYRVFSAIPFLTAPNTGPIHRPRFTFTTVSATDEVTIALPPISYAPPPTNLRLWLYIGKPVAQGISYYKNPFRYTDENLFNGAWTKDPWTVTAPWPFETNTKLFARIVAQDSGRGALSTHYRTFAIADNPGGGDDGEKDPGEQGDENP